MTSKPIVEYITYLSQIYMFIKHAQFNASTVHSINYKLRIGSSSYDWVKMPEFRTSDFYPSETEVF